MSDSDQIVVVSIDSPDTVVTDNTSTVSSETSYINTVVNDKTGNIIIEVPSVATVTAGVGGPKGADGISEEDMVYAKQVDFVSDSVLYKGEAAVGSLTSAPLWRIRKLILASDNDVSETWASGNANFDKVWDDRLSLTYS